MCPCIRKAGAIVRCSRTRESKRRRENCDKFQSAHKSKVKVKFPCDDSALQEEQTCNEPAGFASAQRCPQDPQDGNKKHRSESGHSIPRHGNETSWAEPLKI